MTSRSPAPWRIVEIAHGFAIEDATGRQLGVFYGRDDPNTAGHTGFLTIDEARQIAVDFARLPELLKQTSARSEFVKTKRQRKTVSRMRAQTPDGSQTSSQLERFPGNLGREKSLNHLGATIERGIKRTLDQPSSAFRPRP
jgi:hypothetical protein